MHISSNVSHWVCVFMGVFLIVTGLVSHAPRRAASSMALPGDTAEARAGTGKRAVLISIGLIAVAYGISRVLS